MSWAGHHWADGLRPAQVQAVGEIRKVRQKDGSKLTRHAVGADGWWVRLTPTTGLSEEAFLIFKTLDGRELVWKLHKDGTYDRVEQEAA